MLHLQHKMKIRKRNSMVIPGNIALFEGIKSDELPLLLTCLSSTFQSFERGDVIIHEGEKIESIGIVLSGSIQILRNDHEGNRNILANFGMGAIFSESFVCAGIKRSPVSVVASETCLIVFMQFSRMMQPCASACSYHQRLIKNMMHLIAQKNQVLNERIEILEGRSIRNRLLILLEQEEKKQGSPRVSLPWNRTELADYLCTDRSALSREISKMKDEGVIIEKGALFSRP